MVKIVKIEQVWGNDYVMKRCNELSLGGKLRRSTVKKKKKQYARGRTNKWRKRENLYVLGKLKPK